MNRENAFDAIWISAYMKPHKTVNSENNNEKRHTRKTKYNIYKYETTALTFASLTIQFTTARQTRSCRKEEEKTIYVKESRLDNV